MGGYHKRNEREKNHQFHTKQEISTWFGLINHFACLFIIKLWLLGCSYLKRLLKKKGENEEGRERDRDRGTEIERERERSSKEKGKSRTFAINCTYIMLCQDLFYRCVYKSHVFDAYMKC